MLLDKNVERNPALIEESFRLHQNGLIRPDSYVIDLDQYLENAKIMLEKAKQYDIKLYFMLKQVGRNPYLAKRLVELGYEGAVVVDYKEAKVMMDKHIPLGNVGHLVQIPKAFLEEVILYGAEVITVYSLEKVREIHEICMKHQCVQKILIRVYDQHDLIYSGQTAGIALAELAHFVKEVKQLNTIVIEGVTSFPAMLYSQEDRSISKTPNLKTILLAKKQLEEAGIKVSQVNIPSVTCCDTISKIKEFGGTHGEPGHGLSGSTPAHAYFDLDEIPSVVYVSEVSHNFDGKGYCYGGGVYRRSHLKNALIGTSLKNAKKVAINTPDLDSIDYHFEISQPQTISDTVIMAFRFQIFVTRSDVVLVEGIQSGNEKRIVAIYDSLGRELIKP